MYTSIDITNNIFIKLKFLINYKMKNTFLEIKQIEIINTDKSNGMLCQHIIYTYIYILYLQYQYYSRL